MGPLAGLKIVELFSIGPGPFAGMLLSDMGAEVLLVDRMEEMKLGYPDYPYRFLYRNRRSVRVDLKRPEGVEAVLRLVEKADGLIEGFRPGVAERLGLGPKECMTRNPRLVYGRMTGYGQTGPLASRAGFDINYISITGALWSIGDPDRPPVPPLILAGDFGGGGVFLAMGMTAAMFEAKGSGKGQVVDAAISDGALNLMAYMYGNMLGGTWLNQRGSNIVDGSFWRYRVYECADGRYISTALLMPKFLHVFCDKVGLDLEELGLGDPDDRENWPGYCDKMSEILVTKTRDEWMALFDGEDDCVMPVLDLEEAPHHPHHVERRVFVDVDGISHPAPAPRFSRTKSEISRRPPYPGEHTDDVLEEWGFQANEIAGLRKDGAVR